MRGMLCAVNTSVSETFWAARGCNLGCLHFVHGFVCVKILHNVKVWCIVSVVGEFVSEIPFYEVQIVSVGCVLD